MKQFILWLSLAVVLLAGSACSRDLVPDSVLEGLHKPVIKGLSPARIQFNGADFGLGVRLNTEDAKYVLYVNDRKAGVATPGYWRGNVGFRLSKELVSELIGTVSASAALSVRVTGIGEEYDISGEFDRYRDYVSEPVLLQVDRGTTRFSPARLLFPEWTHSSEPLIRSDSVGNLYLAWLETMGNYNQAFFSFSADGGQSWSQVLNISRSDSGVYAPDLAVDSAGHFYMAWMAYKGDHTEVFFSRSTDYGATWHLPVRLSADGIDASWPVLATDDRGGVFLAWLQSGAAGGLEILFASSHDLGASWSRRSFGAGSWKPLLATRPGGRLDLLAQGYGNGGMSLRIHSSPDYGTTWQTRMVMAGECYPFSENSHARFGQGEQFCVFWSGVSTAGHAFSLWNYLLTRSTAGEWSAIQNLKDWCPSSGSKFSVVPLGERLDAILDSTCLLLLRSDNGGRTWGVPETIAGSDGEYISHWPDAVRLPSGRTCLVFVRRPLPLSSSLYLTQFE